MSKLEDEARWAALASIGNEETEEEELEEEESEEALAPSVTIVIGRGK